MKKVLLTGATGFIGRQAIAPLLQHGYEVHAVSSQLHPATDGVIWHRANLLDATDIEALMKASRATQLLHFAWYVEHGKFWRATENIRWVEASLALLRAFAAHGGQRVVMAGTCAEYDWTAGDGLCSEQTTPLRPATLYGVCKHALFLMLMAFAQQLEFSAAWGRIFFVYGPYEPPLRLISSIIRSLLRNETARCSHGNQVRDFLHVQDVADAFVALLDSAVCDAVNIGSGKPVSIKKIVTLIGDQLKKRELIQLGALPVAPDDPPILAPNVKRLQSEVQWQPQIALDDGLHSTINFWKSDPAFIASQSSTR